MPFEDSTYWKGNSFKKPGNKTAMKPTLHCVVHLYLCSNLVVIRTTNYTTSAWFKVTWSAQDAHEKHIPVRFQDAHDKHMRNTFQICLCACMFVFNAVLVMEVCYSQYHTHHTMTTTKQIAYVCFCTCTYCTVCYTRHNTHSLLKEHCHWINVSKYVTSFFGKTINSTQNERCT